METCETNRPKRYNTKHTDPQRRLFELLCELRDDTASLMMLQRTFAEDSQCLDRIEGALEALREKARTGVYLAQAAKERKR